MHSNDIGNWPIAAWFIPAVDAEPIVVGALAGQLPVATIAAITRRLCEDGIRSQAVRDGERDWSVFAVPVGDAGAAAGFAVPRTDHSGVDPEGRLHTLGRLAGGIAHDFNNLLTVVLSSAYFVRDHLTRTDPRLARTLNNVIVAAQRGAGLTTQLLAFARGANAGPRTIDPVLAVEDLLGLLQRTLGSDIEIRTRSARNVWSVRVDPGILDQLLVNLCLNARDAMPHGGALTLDVNNETLDAARADMFRTTPGEYVTITVTDTGTGIDPAVIDKVFVPYFTTKAEGRGTGLGLANCRSIVRQAGGGIVVSSELGVGSSFLVALPRSLDANADRGAGAAAPPPAGAGETILVVEDQLAVLRILSRLLRSHGYNVLEATSAEEAFELAVDCPDGIDVLLTDVQLPRMSGMELATALRRRDPNLPVVFATGLVPQQARELEGPPPIELPKPFTPVELFDVVAGALAD